MGATVIVDAFWGDGGKGKVCAWYAKYFEALLAVRAGAGTNAGASVWLDDDTLYRARQLPTAWLNPNTKVAVGSGTCVDPLVFLDEVKRFKLHKRAKVDTRCPIITPEHIQAEINNAHLASTVGSTCTGNGQARSEYVLRRAKQAKDIEELKPYLADVAKMANKAADDGLVLIQGAQGTFLSLYLSPDYPNVTSVNCTSVAAMNDVGMGWRRVQEVVMVVKSLPTRVGNGPLPYELTAEEINNRGWEERGVVTGRPRRKASQIDWDLLAYSTMLNQPTHIALTFCDHYDEAMKGATKPTAKVNRLIKKIEKVTNAPVWLVDTGKMLDEFIELR